MLLTRLSLFVLICYHSLVACQGSISDVTYDLFGSSKNGVAAAFGDFNADKMTDIFVLTDSGQMVQLLEAEEDVTKTRPGFRRKLLIKTLSENEAPISSMVPVDFDGDSQMDLLVTRQADKSSPVAVHIYWGDSSTDLLYPGYLKMNVTLKDQPSVIDVNGDMLPDLVGEISESGQRTFFVFGRNRSYTQYAVTNGTSTEQLDPLRVPQSSGFFDFNGDLVPDLCMVSEKDGRLQFEIWLNQEGVLTWQQTILSPPEMKQFGRPSFFDLNDNQEINIILPGCLNGGGDCSKSAVFVYGRGMWSDLHVNFKQGSEAWEFAMESLQVEWLKVPMALRLGDFNLDGFPDALTVLKSHKNNTYAVFLMNNIASSDNFSRSFYLNLNRPLYTTSKYAPLATFYDIAENGILDVLLSVYSDNTVELRALEQDFTNDAYFLKVMVLSGFCEFECKDDHKPYGVNQVGPVIRFKTTTSTGDSEIGVASQLSQSAYYSLQLPFEVFGLGQTPNFVDQLEVGIQNPHGTQRLHRSWTSIIPNSQVVVIPHPQNSPSSWITKLYVTPSRLVLLTGASLLGTCAVIAIVIALLHWRERVEDKKEKLQESQRFHFDAM